MFATYSLNIRRLLTQSICRRPNLHVKSEHRRIIAEYSLAVRKKIVRGSAFFSIRVVRLTIMNSNIKHKTVLKKPANLDPHSFQYCIHVSGFIL